MGIGEICILVLKIYLLGFALSGAILSALLNDDAFYKAFIEEQKKIYDQALNQDEEMKSMANMINFNIEDHIGMLVFECALNSWLALSYIFKIFKISRKKL